MQLYIKSHFNSTAIIVEDDEGELDYTLVVPDGPDLLLHSAMVENALKQIIVSYGEGPVPVTLPLDGITIEKPYIALEGNDSVSSRIVKIMVSQRKYGAIMHVLMRLFPAIKPLEVTSGHVRKEVFGESGCSKDRLLSIVRWKFQSCAKMSVISELTLADCYLLYEYKTKNEENN